MHHDDGVHDTAADAPAPEPSASRRRLLGASAAGALMALVDPAVRSGAWAQGSDAPEKKEVKVGFIPLTDCASVVIASVMEFDKKYGIKIVPSKEASWAAVRDKLVNGELDAAHVLYGLIYGVHLGIGGPKKDMAILMNLNHNGQAITLSNQLKEKGATDGAKLKALIAREKREYTFAQTFPTGTHAMWIYYWLAAQGIHPFNDVKTIVVPPPQMVANMRVGNMDGFCVGEPWNNRAIHDGIGFTAETTQGVWKDHPEKTLGTTAEFVQKNPNTARAMIAAILDAGKYIDVMANRKKVAEIVADKSYVNCPVDIIDQRLEGNYDNGIGRKWKDPDYMKFYNDGYVTFPFLSDGMWFLTQHRRWGLLKEDPDYLAVAKQVNRIDLYTQAAAMTKTPLPKDPMRTAKLIDGVVWDGKNPKAYAAGFAIKGGGVTGTAVAAFGTVRPGVAMQDPHPLQRVADVADPAAANDAREARLAEVRADAALRAEARRRQARAVLLVILPPMIGIALFVGLWALVSMTSPQLPSPAKTFASAVDLFSRPFYRKGPNDQGIGWNVLMSLQRVGIGFGLAALVGIPLGFVLGRFAFAHRMAAPIISLLRPVSPLAWLPIGLMVFKAANPAAIWVIFISSIWPMVINTAVGVQRVPQDYLNVARVLNLSEWKIVTRILLPASLPFVLTGVRLSIGVAWLVIVAAEMLTGGVGIGFWVWDEWNNLNVEHILIAIFVVGVVGLALEQAILLVARRFNYA